MQPFHVEDVTIAGKGLDVTVDVISIDVTAGMSDAPRVTLTVSDYDRQLISSPVTRTASLLAIHNLTFALVGISKQADNLELTFRDHHAVQLMARKANADQIRAAAPNTGTRGEFVRQLITDVGFEQLNITKDGDPAPTLFTPTQTAAAPVAAAGGAQPSGGAINKVAWAAAHPNGGRWSGTELIEAIATAMAESGGRPTAVGRNRDGTTDTGLWQVNSIHGIAQSTLKDPLANARAARKIYDDRKRRTGRGWTAWYAHTPKGKPYGSGSRYRQYLTPARAAAATVTAERDAGKPAQTSQHAGLEVGTATKPDESLWAATGRIAEAVNWRRFVWASEFYCGPDEWLAALAPPVHITEFQDSVEHINFAYQLGANVDTAEFVCQLDLGALRPGQPVVIDDLGAASGDWLVDTISFTAANTAARVTLTRPTTPLPEPANQTTTPATPAAPIGGPSGSSLGQLDTSGAWGGAEAVCRHLCSGFGATLRLTSSKRGWSVRSDHYHGNTTAYAMDWSNGSRPTPQMDAAAKQVMARLGRSYDGVSELSTRVNVTAGGRQYRVQVIYRSMTGGNHFNHIHVGVRRR